MHKEDIIFGNAFKYISEEYLDDNKKYFDTTKKAKIIFLPTDWLGQFRKRVLPTIDYKFKLITHNGDREAPGAHVDLLEDPRIIHWYGMNSTVLHNKFTSIPIGIANEEWPHGNKDILMDVINSRIEKKELLYCNFDISTNYRERLPILETVKSMKFAHISQSKLNFEQYLNEMSKFKYVIAPPGNGVDCHRIWEAIYLGVIPIVKWNIAYHSFIDLPILVVKRYSILTEEFLELQYNEIMKRSITKALFSYYKEKIFA